MKLFSPEKADALIPRLQPMVDELMRKRRDLAIRLLEADPAVRGIEPARQPRVAGLRSPFAPGPFSESKADIVRLIGRIESHGCIVKDLDLGLLDFPAEKDGAAGFLCWKYGESRVSFWHGTNEGFAERRSLE